VQNTSPKRDFNLLLSHPRIQMFKHFSNARTATETTQCTVTWRVHTLWPKCEAVQLYVNRIKMQSTLTERCERKEHRDTGLT